MSNWKEIQTDCSLVESVGNLSIRDVTVVAIGGQTYQYKTVLSSVKMYNFKPKVFFVLII